MNNSLSLMVSTIDLTISIVFPVLLAVSTCSFVLSVIQAVTSVQEQTMQFILKVAVFIWVFNKFGLDYWFRIELFFNDLMQIIANV